MSSPEQKYWKCRLGWSGGGWGISSLTTLHGKHVRAFNFPNPSLLKMSISCITCDFSTLECELLVFSFLNYIFHGRPLGQLVLGLGKSPKKVFHPNYHTAPSHPAPCLPSSYIVHPRALLLHGGDTRLICGRWN